MTEDNCETPSVIEDSSFSEGTTKVLDATLPAFVTTEAVTDADRRLALLYELTLQFGSETSLDALLDLIVNRVVSTIPGAVRGALLVKDPATGNLALKAHVPAGNPSVSLTMARQAMERRKAFVWPPPPLTDPLATNFSTPSIDQFGIASAMYAPLVWKNEVLGVVCVDNCQSCTAFADDDLRLLQAVAHHAAIAVANLQLQGELRREIERLNNFSRLVSPQVSERLKQQRGPIRLGGEFRDATILFSDIRGFTNLSATMSPAEVTDMLEDYFGSLVPVVFRYQGMIDKFVGDAIMAVFGSPDADEHQQIHAVQAALGMQTAMREVNDRRAAKGKLTGELGIGIQCGEVVHGFIGTRDRMEFTVIGDAVNRASRYCDGARAGEVLISPEVHQWIWNQVEVEPTSIQTKHEGILTAYRVKRVK